jgi:hypothetical protein
MSHYNELFPVIIPMQGLLNSIFTSHYQLLQNGNNSCSSIYFIGKGIQSQAFLGYILFDQE